MIALKEVTHDTKTNSVEATWEDADGVRVKCHSYADVQMGMFRADVLALGGNIAEHEAMIATVEAAIVPVIRLLPEVKADLKQRVAAKRWQVETGGTTIAGIPVATDVQSQTKITGALSLVTRNPALGIQWKGADGVFVWLDKAAMEAVADGVGAFVIACFNAEAAHVTAIDALPSIAACQGYDVDAGWPA